MGGSSGNRNLLGPQKGDVGLRCVADWGEDVDCRVLQRSALILVGFALAVGALASAPAGSTPPGLAPPSMLASPSISGRAVSGSTMDARSGSWSGKSISYGYQWARCDSSGRGCRLVGGATQTTYKLTSTDSGTTLRVSVTATNTSGTGAATSAQTGVVAAALSTTGPGAVLWAGNYETGDFSQWWLHQWSINRDPNQGYTANNVGHSSATIITSPVAQGRYASEFQVFPTTGTNPNDRAEAVATQANSGGYPGQEWYYGWWTFFPGPTQTWWSQGGDWNDITQFFSTDNVASQLYLGIDATNGTPRIYVGGMPLGKRILTTLQYDHWYHFIVHAKWSTNPNVGLMEIWLDGLQVVPLTHGATLRDQNSPANSSFTSPGMYLSQGIYRGAFTSTNTVIHDGLCRTDSYSAAADC